MMLLRELFAETRSLALRQKLIATPVSQADKRIVWMIKSNKRETKILTAIILPHRDTRRMR
jgi:hypothetical protein